METTKAPGIRAVCLAELAQTQAGVAGDVLADPPSFETFANLDHSAHPPPHNALFLERCLFATRTRLVIKGIAPPAPSA